MTLVIALPLAALWLHQWLVPHGMDSALDTAGALLIVLQMLHMALFIQWGKAIK